MEELREKGFILLFNYIYYIYYNIYNIYNLYYLFKADMVHIEYRSCYGVMLWDGSAF